MAQIGFGYEGIQFLKAVREGDGAKATELANLSGPGVINHRGEDGDAALHIVTRYRSNNWMGYLLQKGADPNLSGRDGDTPLIIAARLGFTDGAERLLSKGANIDKVNKLGESRSLATSVFSMLMGVGRNGDRKGFDGSKLPDFKDVAPHLAPAGGFLSNRDDGWVGTVFVLKK
jgi:ankyrin repeat protein